MTIDILTLDMPQTRDAGTAGTKAAHLARLRGAGLPVPPGFVVTPIANPDDAGTRRAIADAFDRLRDNGAGAVAVRSSATAEDLADASFAGQQETVLNVTDHEALHDAIDQVRASLRNAATVAYRERVGIRNAAMAVLVQRQVDASVSGAAFSQDPITGEPAMVIEAVPGLGDTFMAGKVTPRVWRVQHDGRIIDSDNGSTQPLLPADVIREIVEQVRRAEQSFEQPQDVEWAWDGEQVWMLQARPITTRRDRDFFTEYDDAGDWLWTASFLNERFTHPVSPLGWSIVADPLEQLAFRKPLALLGADDIEGPLLKLWRGHPYSRVAAWQRIYKLFPDGLLPEDAARYFPAGDVSLRRAPKTPQWGAHLLWNGIRALLADRRGASPLHNPSAWRDFEHTLDAWLTRLETEEGALPNLPAAQATSMARRLLHEAQALTDDLLGLHRWSLLYADMSYSLLRRLLRARHGPGAGARRAARLTAGVQSHTAHLNEALDELARRVAARPDLKTVLADAQSIDDIATQLGADTPFLDELRAFLDRYGHRFFSLDIADPPYEAAPAQLFSLLRTRAADAHRRPRRAPREPAPIWLRPFVQLARDYIRLREDQRFAWQRILAFQRRIALHLGGRWASAGILDAPEQVFGMTWGELTGGDITETLAAEVARRLARYRRLREQFAVAPQWHYPDFLRGNHPLAPASAADLLRGRPVSPGIAQGRVCVVTAPDEFDRVQQGDILVAQAPDPGWTPIFGTIAGLITERGGQLSHAAVVAREYGLPAVAGIAGVLDAVETGQQVLVDGTEGIVRRLE